MGTRLGTLLVLLAGVAGAQQAPGPARARVTYVAAGTAYLDAGRDEGLREGHQVRLVRQGQAVGRLTVTALASHRAACAIDTTGIRPVVGDTVEFAQAAAPPAPPGAPRPRTASRATGRGAGIHGRVGVRYLTVRPREGQGFSQPAADLRLDAPRLGGTALGLVVDVRARRTHRTRSDGTGTVDARDAVYQAALLVRPGGPGRLTIGRQYLPTVSSVSLFDGALLEYQGRRFGAGVFAGAEPDPATMGWSSELRDIGFFVEGRSGPGAPTRLAVSAGALGSYARDGTVNREFGFIQASVSSRRLSVFLAQELDLNRAWKAEAGEPGLALTSTFVSLMARPTDAISLNAGFDNRRNVRLYRDYVSPESAFDDSFRRGVWAGVSASVAGHLRFGLDGRTAFGEDSLSRTRSVTGSLGLDRLGRAGLSIRSRHTRYRAPGRAGWLHSGSAGLRPAPWFGIEASVGARREQGVDSHRRTTWSGLDLDLLLGRSLYLLTSLARERGDAAAGDQVYAGLSWRF